MTAITAEANDVLDRYLRRMRLSLGGTSLDAKEVERDVRSHIDVALAERDEPVSRAAMEEVLERLGSPMQWVPDEEIAFWRRAVARLMEGPEDWRLAYWSLGLTLLGFLTLPLGIGIVLIGGAFLLSRAAISLADERGEELGPKKWLVYPPLVFFSVLLMIVVLFLPVAAFGGFAGETWPYESVFWQVSGIGESAAALGGAIAAVAGVWWMILACVSAMAVTTIRRAFLPLMSGYRRLHAAWLALAGLVLAIAGVGVMLRF